jgi:hypothetical protein
MRAHSVGSKIDKGDNRTGLSALRSLVGVDRTWRGMPDLVKNDPKPTFGADREI